MTILYATTADLAAWITPETVPDNGAALIRSASLLITEETQTAYYAASTSTGLPTDTAVIAAFKDATCAQCAVWINLGVDPNLAGYDAKSPVKGSKILGGEVSYDTSGSSSATAFAAKQRLITELCPESQRILRQANLLGTRVWTYG